MFLNISERRMNGASRIFVTSETLGERKMLTSQKNKFMRTIKRVSKTMTLTNKKFKRTLSI